jgi:GMP synthase-like glutamine amidotransferase
MRVHYLQHVSFEGLSSIEPFLRAKGHELTATHLYQGDALPAIDAFDWLIVMGGPMGVCDYEDYPWLAGEKQCITSAIEAGKIVLGICLGAQLIADALGATVSKNGHREIGWFNLSSTADAKNTILSDALPENAEVFHWHGDTFGIPDGATALVSSEACQNQGFILNDRVVGFQFHLETTEESASALIEHCRDELDGSKYVQSEQTMLSQPEKFQAINQIMFSVLNKLERVQV